MSTMLDTLNEILSDDVAWQSLCTADVPLVLGTLETLKVRLVSKLMPFAVASA